ncbi:MAG: hypothetical protein HKP56_05285 [Anderseniella sp.]|nr:hypothetical protein [Anderseniella sp.]
MSQHADILSLAKRRNIRGFTYRDLILDLDIVRAHPRLLELKAKGHEFREAWEVSSNGKRYKRFWLVNSR